MLPIVAMFFSVKFNSSYSISTILFYALPGIYVLLRFGKIWQWWKALLFSVLFTTPFTIIVDYIGIKSGLWYTPTSSLAVRFLGIIPWEDFLWMIAGTYTIIMIYETLVSEGKQELINRRAIYFVLSAIIVLSIFFLFFVTGRTDFFIFESKYAYLILASIFFLFPALLFVIKFPEYLKNFLPLSVYFLYLTILFEITATYLHQWIFTGKYLIPPLNIFGNTPIPYEELFFVGVVGPIVALSLYEFFDNSPVETNYK